MVMACTCVRLMYAAEKYTYIPIPVGIQILTVCTHDMLILHSDSALHAHSEGYMNLYQSVYLLVHACLPMP